ncbi:MAG: 6-hydroxymethylpterin diphosphokinase MptE-like protein [Spirochaetia bacterium]
MMQEIIISAAKNGSPTARVNGKQLISPYNPEREAERFLTRESENPESVLIILGDTLGYLEKAAEKVFPGVKLLRFAFHPDLRGGKNRITPWVPGDNPDTFLLGHLEEEDLPGLRVIEWPQASEFFPQTARDCRESVLRIISRLNANLVTTGYFGRRWLRNTVFNYLLFEHLTVPSSRSDSAFIAASGPSLEESIRDIKKYRKKFDLWALPSSITPLLSAGIIPDAAVCSDPGHYSLLHFKPLLGWNTELPLAMPLYGVQGLQDTLPLFLFSGGSFYEDDLLDGLEVPKVPQNGTVSGTAMLLLKALGYRNIVFAGLDFTGRDIRSHVRPHTFDAYYHERTDRTNPLVHQLFTASLGTGSFSRQLETYREWFGGLGERQKKGVYRINPSAVNPGIPEITGAELSQLSDSDSKLSFSRIKRADFTERKKTAERVIRGWEDEYRRFITENDRADRGKELAKMIGGSDYLDFLRTRRSTDKTRQARITAKLEERGNSFFRSVIRRLEGVLE